MIDDFKESTWAALRLTSLAVNDRFGLVYHDLVSLPPRPFVYVLQRYGGAVEARLTGAGLFLLVTLVAAAFLRRAQGVSL